MLLSTHPVLYLLTFLTPILALNPKPCSLLGPSVPAPQSLSTDPSIKNLTTKWTQLLSTTLSASGIDQTSTSFSVDVYSVHDKQSLFNYHHTAPSLQRSTEGTHNVTDDSIYRIGSVSKVLTGYTYLLAAGDVSFNEPITKFVPELARYASNNRLKLQSSPIDVLNWDAITIGALASQMAGIPRDFPGGAASDEKLSKQLGLPEVKHVEARYCGEPVEYPCDRQAFFDSLFLQHPVETSFYTTIYSNAGFQILAYALENITGVPFPQLLAKHLVEPLGLSSTTYQMPNTSKASIIPVSANESWYNANTLDATPAGGLYSSTSDLRTIGKSILDSTILPNAQTRRWLKPHSFTADPNVAVGAPWEIARAPTADGRVSYMYTKGGLLGLYSSQIVLLPDWDVGFTVFGAGTGAVSTVAALSAQVAGSLVPVLEQAASREAERVYGGRYGSNETGVSVVGDDGGPGLRIEQWKIEGRDMLEAVRVLVSGTADAKGEVSVRLYPTGLERKVSDGGSERSWRAVFELLDPKGQQEGYCSSWFVVDSVNYGGVSVDEFVINTGKDGIAEKIEVRALSMTFERSEGKGLHTSL